MMAFAYLAQQRCYPGGVPDQFNSLVHYVAAAQQFGEQVPEWLQQLCLDEREPPRERFTTEDLRQATETLGFGEHGPLKILYEDADTDDAFVTNAVAHAFEQASVNGKSTREIGEAYRIVALARGNRNMVKDYRSMAERGWMSLDEAYRMLGATKDVDDAMLITVATLQMSDSPFDADKVKDAILFIAQARGSLRLKKFLETGQDREFMVVLQFSVSAHIIRQLEISSPPSPRTFPVV
jgi:ubiquitin carboxyl-terminal hydrolase 25/28